MSKYPVESSDIEGQIDAINYLLSGPSGIGQNFAGFSSDTTAYITAFNRNPFTTTTPNFILGGFPITITYAEQIGDRLLGYRTSPSNQLFNDVAPGMPVQISGIVPNDWDSASLALAGNDIDQIGYVGYDAVADLNLFRTISPIITPLPPYVSGGTAFFDGNNRWLGTDCEVFATCTGNTDRVFINGQMQLSVVPIGTGSGNIRIALVRYTLTPNDVAAPPANNYINRTTLVEKVYTWSPSTPSYEALFLSVVDNPGIGTYRYVIEVQFQSVAPLRKVTRIQVDTRSISTQVVKE